MRLKVSSAKRRPFCLGLNVLNHADKSLAEVILNQFIMDLILHTEIETQVATMHQPEEEDQFW